MALSAFLEHVVAANREIYDALALFKRQWYERYSVGAGGDVSLGLDLFAEEIFVKHLGGFGTIESEESGIIGEGEPTIIIDPIDGSTNAVAGIPYFGTSIARVDETGVLSEAVVCNLATGHLYLRNSNAELLSYSLHTKKLEPLQQQPIQKVGIFERSYDHPTIVLALHRLGLKYRAPGAVALSLIYARQVDFMLFVGNFRIYDFAAGLAFCEGLEVVVESDYVIVAQKRKRLEELERIVKDR